MEYCTRHLEIAAKPKFISTLQSLSSTWRLSVGLRELEGSTHVENIQYVTIKHHLSHWFTSLPTLIALGVHLELLKGAKMVWFVAFSARPVRK